MIFEDKLNASSLIITATANQALFVRSKEVSALKKLSAQHHSALAHMKIIAVNAPIRFAMNLRKSVSVALMDATVRTAMRETAREELAS